MKKLAWIAIVLNGFALLSFVALVITQGYADYYDLAFLVVFAINMAIVVDTAKRA